MTRKLLDDCFLHDRDRLRHDEAIALLSARIATVVGDEDVALSQAAGRILAAPAVARHPVPLHTNAAVDGYAFSAATYDRQNGATLPVLGRAAAGHALAERAEPGTAVRIFTGAVLPEGCDAVVMQEDVDLIDRPTGPHVTIPPGVKPNANVRRSGEDVATGDRLLEAGDTLRPQDLAALASIGLADVRCCRRVRAAIVSTGDEVIRPGSGPLSLGQVYDANAPMLQALAHAAGADVADLGVWPDDADEVRRRLTDAATRFDVILTTGGASRGEEDHMVTAIDAIGRRHLWQLAIKPGRPMSFGQIGDTVVLGLPGNPVAVFVCFLMYAFPVLRRLGGAPWREPTRYPVPSGFAQPSRKTGRREFWRASLLHDAGGLRAEKFARDGSGLISGLRISDGLIEVGEDVESVKPGDTLAFIPYSEFGILR